MWSNHQEIAMFKRFEGVVSAWGFFAGVTLALVVLTGCPSLSTMQTPATVPKGDLRFGVGLEGVGYSEKESGGAISTVTAPQFEINARYGVTDKIDVGAKLYLIGAEVGGKYQFVKGSFEAAVAPAASYISVSLGGGDSGDSSSFSVTYLHLPLLLGYKVTDWFELAFGPKALYAIAAGSASDSTNQSSVTSSGFMVGGFGSLQLKIGRAFWLAPEVNVYKPFTKGATGVIWQGGLALLFGGAPSAAMASPMGPP